jgi:glycosyltransferase involved in cell wall biosynthesis
VRITFVKIAADPRLRRPEDLIAADDTRRGFGAALARRGHDVTIIEDFPVPGERVVDGVRWVFVPPDRTTRLGRDLLARLGDPEPWVHAPATALVPAIAASRPEVVHAWDLTFSASLLLFGHLARRLRVPLVVHYHGGAPARRRLVRPVERASLATADRLLFTTRERARTWVESGAIPDDRRVVEILETSTPMGDRPATRSRSPVYLCAGRLDPVKDPLTTIRGFARIREHQADATLLLAYNTDPLLPQIRAEVAADPRLRDAVTFLGRVPHADMEALYGRAHVLLQSSVREVCGVAVLEAMACGTIPVVTDIPSFRRLTCGGRFGRLFRVGDPADLARQALSIPREQLAALSDEVRAHFRATATFDVLAAQLETIYAEAMAEKRP